MGGCSHHLALAALLLFAVAATASPAKKPPMVQLDQSDIDVLNLALNLEYLEANFYSFAAFGRGIDTVLLGGGPMATGGRKAMLSPKAQLYAEAIARDEIAHVKFLRSALGSSAVPQPQIDIGPAFVAAANAAFKTTLSPPFDAYGDDALFYHAAFVFEDVGVTAYKGAAPLIKNPAILEAAAGILATEAYHGGAIRTLLLEIADQFVFPYATKVSNIVQAISDLQDKVDGPQDKDKGLLKGKEYIVAPGDSNAIAFSRTVGEVLHIVYLGGTAKGGFFPNGFNGNLKSAKMGP